jgi:hypothetical protein
MTEFVTVVIPVRLDAAPLLRDADTARKVGAIVSELLRPANLETEPLDVLVDDLRRTTANATTQLYADLVAHDQGDYGESIIVPGP